MALPLFIEDGYTTTATIPEPPNGEHPEMTITFRALVGSDRSQWLSESAKKDSKRAIEFAAKLVSERLLDINGMGQLSEEKLTNLNPNALLAIRDYILLLDGRAIEEDRAAQKNSTAG